jgi:hypothetical protein
MIAIVRAMMGMARTKVVVELGIFSAERLAGATWHGV